MREFTMSAFEKKTGRPLRAHTHKGQTILPCEWASSRRWYWATKDPRGLWFSEDLSWQANTLAGIKEIIDRELEAS